jgi:transcriptional regulator with XRE-family HTH domain
MVPLATIPFSLAAKELMERLAAVFGKRVRALREARRWTQEQLARASGLGAKHIGVIERGEKTSSFEAVERLARAFEVECYTLFVPHHRRTSSIEKEIDALLNDENRISLANVDEFLRGLRGVLKKLDRKASV